ncbi:HEAT repeat domain-containing protein [Spirillospora sp. NPDC047279]|uniref:HEAT repeat domain-containing protein n=1 Tax=Spirillospora sp. NPDC047279 TaxID=3155478 RepID=UPI0033C1F322
MTIIDADATTATDPTSSTDPTGGGSSSGLLARVVELHRIADPDPADIEPYLRDAEPEVRGAALGVLIRAANAGALPSGLGDTLAWALADEDEQVRGLAAEALRDLPELYIGDDGVKALLLAARHGRDALVRESAAGLLDVLAEGAAELYAQGLHDGEVHVRIQAVLGLVALHAVAEVAEAADDPAREVRVAVAEGLARLAVPAGLPVLEHLLADHDAVVRMASLDAAAELGLPEPLEGRVITAVAHQSWQVRKRAALALGVAGAEVAVQPLLHALRDRIVDVRRAAVQSLEQWAADRPEVVTALTEALADPDPGVRTQVRWALA